VQSPRDTLDAMLEEHLPEVQALMLQRKLEYEELNDVSSRTDEPVQLKSPPRGLLGGKFANEGMGGKTPKGGPPVGMFSVSPGPRSPLKRGF
jgi:histone deacetylase 6